MPTLRCRHRAVMSAWLAGILAVLSYLILISRGPSVESIWMASVALGLAGGMLSYGYRDSTPHERRQMLIPATIIGGLVLALQLTWGLVTLLST